MLNYLLLAFTVLLGVGKNIFTKLAKNKASGIYETMKMNVITYSLAFVSVFILSLGSIKTFFYTPWLLVICFSVCSLFAQISLIKAVELGPVSLSSLFYSSGFIVATLFNIFYFNEPITVMHVVGMTLVFLSLAFSVKKEEGKKFNFGWLIAALGGTLFSGALGIVQKFFTTQPENYNLNNFICLAFILSIIINLVMMLITKPKNKCDAPTIEQNANEQENKTDKRALIQKYTFMIVLGVIFGVVNITNTYLVGVLPSVVIFPVLNGGVILTTTLLSALIFKEKISTLQKIGLVVGILGIICVTIGNALI